MLIPIARPLLPLLGYGYAGTSSCDAVGVSSISSICRANDLRTVGVSARSEEVEREYQAGMGRAFGSLERAWRWEEKPSGDEVGRERHFSDLGLARQHHT